MVLAHILNFLPIFESCSVTNETTTGMSLRTRPAAPYTTSKGAIKDREWILRRLDALRCWCEVLSLEEAVKPEFVTNGPQVTACARKIGEAVVGQKLLDMPFIGKQYASLGRFGASRDSWGDERSLPPRWVRHCATLGIALRYCSAVLCGRGK